MSSIKKNYLINHIKIPSLPMTKNYVLINRYVIKDKKSIRMKKLFTEQSTSKIIKHTKKCSYTTISTQDSKVDIDISKVNLITHQLLSGKKYNTSRKQVISLPAYSKNYVDPKKMILDNIRNDNVKTFKSYPLQITCFGSDRELHECINGMRVYQKKKELQECLPVISRNLFLQYKIKSLLPKYNSNDFVYKSFKREQIKP